MLRVARTSALMMLLALLATACRDEVPRSPSESAAEPVSDLHARSLALSELHEPAPAVRSGDWLAEHDESGQTFAEYLDEEPVAATAGRRRIYVVPIGEFDTGRQAVFDRTVEALRHWFGLEVVVEAAVPLSAIPRNSTRQSNHGDWLQLHAGYLMRRVLLPDLPDDAACRIGFVSADLWPGRGWNFVFGQASLRDRIGVWSLYRNGDPNESEAAARLCLLRTVKTATHEIGHMFGMRHCTAWSCNLAGSNHQDESDRQPWRLCPECLPKLLRATGVDAGERFAALRRFGEEYGLPAEAEWFARAADAWPNTR